TATHTPIHIHAHREMNKHAHTHTDVLTNTHTHTLSLSLSLLLSLSGLCNLLSKLADLTHHRQVTAQTQQFICFILKYGIWRSSLLNNITSYLGSWILACVCF